MAEIQRAISNSQEQKDIAANRRHDCRYSENPGICKTTDSDHADKSEGVSRDDRSFSSRHFQYTCSARQDVSGAGIKSLGFNCALLAGITDSRLLVISNTRHCVGFSDRALLQRPITPRAPVTGGVVALI